METLLKQNIKPIISSEELQIRIKEIAEQLNNEYKEEVYLICVLRGAIMFMSDLMKHLVMPVKIEFIRLSSYGSGTVSSGQVNAVDIKLPDLNDKNVLIIEDIIDTGHTAEFLTNFINHNFNVKSYKFIALLDKPSRRVIDINADIVGLHVEDKFLVGFGLDYDGYYRNLDYIGYIE